MFQVFANSGVPRRNPHTNNIGEDFDQFGRCPVLTAPPKEKTPHNNMQKLYNHFESRFSMVDECIIVHSLICLGFVDAVPHLMWHQYLTQEDRRQRQERTCAGKKCEFGRAKKFAFDVKNV